jgi:hypothetical protein
MIDLHMHTTASDGKSTPAELVARIRALGIHTFAVTDHDTVAGVAPAAAAAAAAGLRFVPGIEITAVHNQKDVHMLGYFVDHESPTFLAFLADSLADRLRRARRMSEKLAELGVPIDIDRIVEETGGPNSGKAIARPVIARALLAAGHVASVQEAFDRFLAEGQPAYFGRVGATPVEVVSIIHAAGGMACFAHPGATKHDELIEPLVAAGLDALEVYHSEHTPETSAKYLEVARRHRLAVTGGSDYHGEGAHRAEFLGRVSLPEADFADFVARYEASRSAAGGRA